MTKRFTKSFTAILILLCLALVSSTMGAFAIGNANAEATNEEIVTLNSADDFAITSGVLSGLSEQGQGKIADAASYTVVVPDTVTEINEGAFAGLSRLTSLSVPFVGNSATATGAEGLLGYMFGRQAYLGATLTNQAYASEELSGGDTHQQRFNETGYYRAYIPYSLAEVTVTGGNLSHGAFSYCKHLYKVTLGDSVEVVGDLAFYQSNISDVNLGNVTTIGRRAFENAKSLKTVDIGKVESIGIYAFAHSGLYQIDLPQCLGDGMEPFAFFDCANLVSIKVNGGVNIPMSKQSDTGASLSAFASCIRLCEVIDLRTDISADNFSNWGSLPQIGIAPTIKTNDNAAFEVIEVNEYALRNVTTETEEGTQSVWYLVGYIGTDKVISLPDAEDLTSHGITSYGISNFAFYDIPVVVVDIPSCVTSVGNLAFTWSSLVKVTIGDPDAETLPMISFGASFVDIASLREIFNYSKGFAWTDGQGVTVYNAGVEGAVEPESKIKVMGDYLFNLDDENIELTAYFGNGGTITLPDEATVGGKYRISNGVFSKNADILGVILPEAVTEIGEKAFNGCASLVNISIEGTSLKSIGLGAFADCAELASISLPNSVEHIASTAFHSCLSLTSINLPSSLKTWGTEQFAERPTDKGYIFQDCTALTAITIPAGVTDIPKSSFSGCSSLATLTFADGCQVVTIEEGAFYGTALTSLVLPASVEDIGQSAFSGAPIEQLYLEENSNLKELGGSFASANFKSFNIANASKDIEITVAYGYKFNNGDCTVFLPSGVGVDVVNKTCALTGDDNQVPIVVVPDKETYDVLMASADIINASMVKSRLYWQTQVTFTVTDTLDNVYTDTQDKLASSSGASIKYVLSYDSAGRPYGWDINEGYSLPSVVGSTVVDANDWLDGENKLTVNATISGDGIIYNMADAVEAKIIAPSDRRIEYTGEEFVLTEKTLTYVRATNKVGNDTTPVDVGEYIVYVKPAEGFVWENGGSEERSFALEICKATATLEWYYNINTPIPGDVVYELTYLDELRIALFSAKYGNLTLTTGNGGISAVIDGQGAADLNLMGEGLYRFTATHKNYEFTNAEIMVRVNPVEVDLGLNNNLVWLAGNDTGALNISSGTVHIGTAAGATVIHTLLHPSIDYTETRNVVNSIVRYTGKDTALTLAASSYYGVSSYKDNVKTVAGIYTATMTLTANPNYKFTTNLVNEFAIRGITVNIQSDGKTAVVTKTWYLIELENELLDSAASIADRNWVEYSIAGWTFGDSGVDVKAPRLVHGDENNDWATSNKYITFELIRNNSIIASNFTREQFAYYINGSMPAGNYKLVATVNVVTLGNGHTHWWDGEEHNNTDDGLVAQSFTREYEFVVDAANISINSDKLILGKNGYEDYRWEITAAANKELFFKKFADKVGENGALDLTSVTRSGYWATASADEYYGGYELTYNFAGMNNEIYRASDSNDLLSFISNDLPDTYIVYFQITVPNHNSLTDIGEDGRYAYYFTVTVFKTIDLPTVIDEGLIYTGSKVLPEITESNLYETVWSSDDDYIGGGKHSVSFRLYDTTHYCWKGESSDTVTVDFTVAKAENVFTVSLNMLGWNFETFDAAVNNIRAASRFLDVGQVVHFKVVKKGETTALSGLGDFTVDANGKVNETVAKSLNALAVGEYTLYATVNGTDNYLVLERNIDFRVTKAINSWADGDDDLALPSWIVGEYDPDVNPIVVNAAHGLVNIIITDIDGNEFYNSLTGVNRLNECEVGKYLLKAWVNETDDFAALAERTFTIEVLKKIGLPWWGTLLITLGALLLAAAIIFVLWKKGVFQILTGKIVLAIRTRASVDATIASVRAAKKMEEGRQSVAEAKRRERLEELQRRAKEQRALSPEERAAQLEAKAQAESEKAGKILARSEQMQAKAARLRGKADTSQEPDDPEVVEEVAVAKDSETKTE